MTAKSGANAARKPGTAHIEALRAARDAAEPNWHDWAVDLRDLVIAAYETSAGYEWRVRAKALLDQQGDEMAAWVNASQHVIDEVPVPEP